MQTRLDHSLISAAAGWNLDVRAIRQDIDICGSPERCEFRFVIENSNNDLYVIESLIKDKIPRKQTIASCMNHLFSQGLSKVNPYLLSENKSYIEENDKKFWQISRFVDGVCLIRPEYVFDQWRGNALADFLIDLRRKSENMPGFGKEPAFSIIDYIITLYDQIKTRKPDLAKEIQPVIHFLGKHFFKAHNSLRTCFCHGDFHALNAIWSDRSINAVIDWEFSGIKPEIYDIANMIGCIGIENPEALAGPLVTDFICRIKKAAIISGHSWKMLIEYIIALRFAWLSEWLRHQDREMIDLETVYMKLLIHNANDLRHLWSL